MDDNYIIHVTKYGESFDSIAYEHYSNEKLASRIIDANTKYSDVIIFDAGIELTIPIIEDSEESPASLPPWSR